MNLPDPALESSGLLSMLVLTSLLDVIAGNYFTESAAPRSHNKLKLINEALARQQLAYIIWYITLAFFVDFHRVTTHEAIMVRIWMGSATVASVVVWLSALNGVAGQDRPIAADHTCASSACPVFSIRVWFTVLVLNVFLAALSLGVAFSFIGRPEVVKALTEINR